MADDIPGIATAAAAWLALIGSAGLGILRWRDHRAKLTATADIYYPELSYGDLTHHDPGPPYVRLVVTNSGDKPATISEVGFTFWLLKAKRTDKLVIASEVRTVSITEPAVFTLKLDEGGVLIWDKFGPGNPHHVNGIYVHELHVAADHLFPEGNIEEALRTDPKTFGLPPDIAARYGLSGAAPADADVTQ